MKKLPLLDVMPAVYQIPAFGALITLFLEGTPGLIDAGGRGSLPLIGYALRRLGRSVGELKLVILTHYHPDHAGGLAELIHASSAMVAVHEAEADVISGQSPLPNPYRNVLVARLTAPFLSRVQSQPVPVNYLLRDGDELPIGGGARVVHTPGHTLGSICLYFPGKKLLIAGDAFRHSFRRLSLPASHVTRNPRLAQQSLRRLLELDFKAICFSHSRPLLSGGKEALQELVWRLDAKNRGMEGV
ncbi:MAG: fold metallo-hydrolase [Dehalococcoidia bacterium]|nr:fold metallo-hydrolase [Dehalococcoidia bacterium]